MASIREAVERRGPLARTALALAYYVASSGNSAARARDLATALLLGADVDLPDDDTVPSREHLRILDEVFETLLDRRRGDHALPVAGPLPPKPR